MALTRTVQTQKLNFLDIYRRNFANLSNGSFSYLPTPRAKSLTEVIVYTLLMGIIIWPITASVIAGIQSVFDFFTRKPLPSEKVSHALAKFEHMNSGEVTDCVHKIVENYTRPTSKESSTLRKELINSLSFDENKLKSVVKENLKSIRMEAIQKDLEERGITISSPKANDRFKFTKEETRACDASVAHQKTQDVALYRQRIPAFFQDHNNLGKRMQKVIVEAIENTNTENPLIISRKIYTTREPIPDTLEDLRLAKELDDHAYQQGYGSLKYSA